MLPLLQAMRVHGEKPEAGKGPRIGAGSGGRALKRPCEFAVTNEGSLRRLLGRELEPGPSQPPSCHPDEMGGAGITGFLEPGGEGEDLGQWLCSMRQGRHA